MRIKNKEEKEAKDMLIIPIIAGIAGFIWAIAVWGDKKVSLVFKTFFTLACMCIIVGLIILLIFQIQLIHSH